MNKKSSSLISNRISESLKTKLQYLNQDIHIETIISISIDIYLQVKMKLIFYELL